MPVLQTSKTSRRARVIIKNPYEREESVISISSDSGYETRDIEFTEPTKPRKRLSSTTRKQSSAIFPVSSEDNSSSTRPKFIVIQGQKLEPTVVFDTFWRFAAERKAMDDRRRAGEPAPWSSDATLNTHRFCNTFRVLDKVSQYIIREVIEKGSQKACEVTFRVLLFNTFSKVETYEFLASELEDGIQWQTYNRAEYDRVLGELRDNGYSLYTGAFQKPAPDFRNDAAFKNHLDLIEAMMTDDLPGRLPRFQYMIEVFEYLSAYPGMGNFTSYQLLLGLSYTSLLNFNESDFVVPGLGASSGLSKIFKTASLEKAKQALGQAVLEIEIMRWLEKNQWAQFRRLGLEFSGLRMGEEILGMQLCDIEHTLCEVDKLSRVVHPSIQGLHGRTHIRGSTFKPSVSHPETAFLPKAWKDPRRKVRRIRPAEMGGDVPYVVKRYVVEKIQASRVNSKGEVEYKVRWWGYGDKDATWEAAWSLLDDAPEVVKKFENARKEFKRVGGRKI